MGDPRRQQFAHQVAQIRSISGVYKREVGGMSPVVEKVRGLVEAFEENDGRRPRILVAKMGQDGHDRGRVDRVVEGGGVDLVHGERGSSTSSAAS